jgi:TonB-linked SusC/RagA family outer membrane protein
MKNFLLHKRLLPTLAALILAFAAMAQGKVTFTAKGMVKDETGSPMVGVPVQLRGTSVGTLSDIDGNYTLTGTVDAGTYEMIATIIGYATSSKKVDISASNSTLKMDFDLSPDVLNLDEVVVTGASPTTTRKQLGNAISVIKAENLANTGTTNALGALGGKVMGAQISQNSGDPAGGFSVFLRGVGSVNSGSSPLYIVDGVVVDNSSQNVINRNADAQAVSLSAGQNRLVDLNPSDIERVEVLNGAAAAAIYGSRASKGVVQIFTKRGKSQKTKIEFNTSFMSSSLRKEVAMTTYGKRFGWRGDATANPRLELATDRLTLLTNVGFLPSAGITKATVLRDTLGKLGIKAGVYGNAVNPDSRRVLVNDQYDVTRYNYWDNIFQQATGNESNISFSGGSEKTQYYASFGYLNNDGIIKNTNFKKYTGRLNLDQSLTDWMKISTSLAFNYSKSQDMPNGNNFFNPISSVFIIDNVWKLDDRDALGNLRQVEQVRVNPLSVIETFNISQRTNRVIGNAKLSLFPIKGLTVDAIVGADMYTLTGDQYQARLPYPNAAFFPSGYYSYATDNVFLLNNDLTASYNTKITSDISSTTTAGYQYQFRRNSFFAADGEGLAPFGKTIRAASVLGTAAQSRAELAIWGSYLQQTIGYKDQLFITAAGRVDASSAFGTDNQNIFYPKLSGSWVLNDYLGANKSILSSAKLRAAYGKAGNVTGIGAYDRYDNYGLTNFNGVTSILPSAALANANVRPETMREIEYGADLGFLNNRLSLSVNVYDQKVTDLLLAKNIASTGGGTSILTNESADSTYLSNKGIELQLTANVIKRGSFKWDVGAIFSTNKNVVYGVPGGIISLRGGGGTQSVISGQPFGVYYGTYYARNADGSFLLTTAEDQKLYQPARGSQSPSQILGGEARLNAAGQPAFDYMDNGKTVGTVELRKVLGNPFPKWTGSFNTTLTYKKLSIYGMLDIVQGNQVYNWNRITSNNVGWGPLAEQELKGEVKRGTVASIAGGINGGRIQEEHIEDGSFVKLREMAITYDLGKAIKGIESVNISFVGRNLYSFDKYQGFDPETNSGGQNERVRGDDFGNVPIPRTFILRLGVRF